MDAAEVEFLAEKELVTIIPNFSLDKIYLIGVRARAGGERRAFASGTGAWERPAPGGRSLCGRRPLLRPTLLCPRLSEGQPGGGLRGSVGAGAGRRL